MFVKLFTLHLSQYPCKYTWHTKQLRLKEKSVHLAICRLFSKCQNVLNFEMFVVSCLQYFLDCAQKIINLIFSLFTPTTKHYTSVHPSAQTSKHQSMETSFEAANQSLTNWLSIFLLIVYYKELVSKKMCRISETKNKLVWCNKIIQHSAKMTNAKNRKKHLSN